MTPRRRLLPRHARYEDIWGGGRASPPDVTRSIIWTVEYRARAAAYIRQAASPARQDHRAVLWSLSHCLPFSDRWLQPPRIAIVRMPTEDR